MGNAAIPANYVPILVFIGVAIAFGAVSLLAGRGYSFDQDWYPGFTRAGEPTAHWSFLYPLYLAVVYAVFGYHPLAARLVQALLDKVPLP